MPSGTATVDFGAFPGKSDASVDVTGQAAIQPSSLVEAWIRPADTADHKHDEHLVESLKVMAGNIVAESGFTIYGLNTSQINEPVDKTGADSWRGGIGTRLYGAWSVAWTWI